MNIEQLKHLEAIARSKTMIAAAEMLHITQPALSRSIKRLEADLGVSLFKRSGRNIELSREGELALEYARAIIHEERLMRIALAECADKANALLVSTVAPAPLWRLTALIIERFPDQLLSSRMVSQPDVERDIMNGDADLAISMRPIQYPSVRCCHLMDECIGIAVPKDHRLAGMEKLSPEDLKGETFLMYENIGFWADGARRALPHSEFVMQEDYSVFEQLASAGSALSFVSDALYQNKAAQHRVVIPFDDPVASASFYLVARSDNAAVREIFNSIEAL